MKKLRYTLNLQLFAEEGAVDPGVESVPAAGEQNTGVEVPAAAEPKDNNFEKAFAKRLSAKEQEWQAKYQELEGKYKDYDDLKQVADYFREINQAPDVMSLKERIEMERLQQQAEQQNLPVEVLKRLQQLESKAAKADELEHQRAEEERIRGEQEQQTKAYQEFRNNLETFCKSKEGVDPEKLHTFMHENQIGNFEAAYKAMQYDDMVKRLESAEKDGMKKLLTAKGKIPNVTSTTQTGTVTQSAPKTFAEARARAMQRLSNPE